MQLETQYRLRWRKHSQHHKTRYFSRRHHAVKAAIRLRDGGFVVELDAREVEQVVGWQPCALDAVAKPAQTVTDRSPVTGVCATCARPIVSLDGEWLDTDGMPRCTEEDDSLYHSPVNV